MNNTIPSEWSFTSSGTASMIEWTSDQSSCPFSTDYCWDGYCSSEATSWTLTRNSQSTIGYTNVQFTYFMSMKGQNGNNNCYIEYMTDNINWNIIAHTNKDTSGQTNIFKSWIGKSANNNSNVHIRLRSTFDTGGLHCYYNQLKLTGDPNGDPIHKIPTAYYTYKPTTTPSIQQNPTEYPFPEPTPNPTPNPTILSTPYPSNAPINRPTHMPTEYPTPEPTPYPTAYEITYFPTDIPTINPITIYPTANPLQYTSLQPTKRKPKKMISTESPTINPTIIVAKATLINSTIVNVFSAQTRFETDEYIIIYSVVLFLFVIIMTTVSTLICMKKKSKTEKQIIQTELAKLEKLMYKNGYQRTNTISGLTEDVTDDIENPQQLINDLQTPNAELEEIKPNINDEDTSDDSECEELYNNANRNYGTHVNNTEKQVKNWLHSDVKLPQYYKMFINSGFNSFDMIVEINKIEHLNYIGIPNKAHQIKLMNHIQRLNNSKYNVNLDVGETGE